LGVPLNTQESFGTWPQSRLGYGTGGDGDRVRVGDKGLIKEMAGLFRLREEVLLQLQNFLENFAERSAHKLVKTIQSRIIIPLNRFVYCVGHSGSGKSGPRGLAERF
jgi:NAD-dependent DNA ligase